MKINKNFRKFLLLWSGELISAIGGGLTSFGLGVYIFNKTGSAAGMALVTLLGFLPTVLLSVPAGILADRFDRRIMMMIGDGCSAIGILFILINMLRGEASLAVICVGVFVSSTFSALLEPSFKATITDLLTPEEFSKAGGLVSLAGSARYLFSPVIAGFLLAVSDVKLLLVIDICTFFLTVASAAVVKKGIPTNATEDRENFAASLKGGWQVITAKSGILTLVIVSSFITLFLGMFQILAEPFILSFADSKTLGAGETICALGMLFSSLYLGIRGIKKKFIATLGLSLMLAGIFMMGFGFKQNIVLICTFGFLFFTALPFANNSLEYLVRINIPGEVQGRAWGFIGLISQLGYVVAYAVSGVAADLVGKSTGKGVGTGASIVIEIAGILLILISVYLMCLRKLKTLENSEIAEETAPISQGFD
jgi:MFS family permease